MSQQRITLFFPCISRKKTSPDAKCHFLELPFKIRLQIYHEAGLVSGRIIHLNHWSPSKRSYDDPRTWHNGYDPRHWDPWGNARRARSTALPLSLFAVCRSVHDELRTVLYGENSFVISRKLSRGLRALERLSDATLREMRFLTVRVNVSSCENHCCGSRGYKCGNYINSCPSHISHDAALCHSSNTDQCVISQWRQICTQLARSIQPGKLALYIICDCADTATAQMVIKPSLLLPALRDCGIRLAMHVDEEISALAKDAVLYLSRSPRPGIQPHFRFLDLPKEIQFRILEFTALINYTVTIGGNGLAYGVSCHKKGRIAESNDDMCVDSRPLLQCFCSYAHSAFNFRCNCKDKIFPYSMFIVNREFRDVAMQIFYGKNKFKLLMEGYIPVVPVPSPRSLRLDESIEEMGGTFKASIVPRLADFPHSSIKYLTKLQLNFPWPELDCLQPHGIGWKHWLDTIGLLSRDANLGALTIDLCFNESFYPDLWREKPTFDPEYEGHMLQTYQNFIRPLSALRGLKKLFIYLNWDASFELPDGRPEREDMLEKMVMGETYDAWKHGKVFQYPGPLENYLL